MQTHFQECELGFTFKSEDLLVFFGNAKATQVEIEKKFPALNFLKIKQTHSDLIIKASDQLKEADAHWGAEKNIGLLISTADCTPIMIYDSIGKKIAAIHAGWRGVENQICLKTLKLLSTTESSANDFEIWMGPHILKASFEVHADVLTALLNSSYSADKSVHFSNSEHGIYVDLKSILESQIHSLMPDLKKINSLLLDTKTNLKFHSFRRDKALAGRNLSFIAMI
ncbi:MAG: polyphenol oxidase family protein [Pseudobdellovibrio sp.]